MNKFKVGDSVHLNGVCMDRCPELIDIYKDIVLVVAVTHEPNVFHDGWLYSVQRTDGKRLNVAFYEEELGPHEEDLPE